MKRSGTVVAAIVAFVGMLALAAPAVAEGSWTSSIYGAHTSFNSRTWTDRNSDNADTKIRFDNCREYHGARFDSTRVQLTRETPWYQPDENRGRRTFECRYSDTENWGDQPRSDYHFTIVEINGCGSCYYRLNVGYVKVAY